MLVGRHVPGDELPGRRYLRGAVLGVALSLVPLVVVLVVADGMIEGITARYIETSTYHLQAHPLVRMDLASLVAAAGDLRSVSGVLAAYPETQGPAVAISGSRSSGAAIRAIDPAFLADPGTRRYLRAVEGELSLTSTGEILLGEALARSLGAHPGDSVSVVTARPGRAGEGGFAPKISIFRVVGVVSAGYRELDALWAFVTLKAGGRVLSPESSRSLIGIKTTDPFDDLSRIRMSIASALSPEWTVVAWPEAERNVWKSFATTRALLLVIMALVVAVAAINVSSALVMLVLERRRDIAVLKSEGASSSFVGLVFLLAGLVTGGAGTFIGIGIGALVAWRVNELIAAIEYLVNLVARVGARLSGSQPSAAIRFLNPAYYLERIPVRVDPAELAFVAAASLALCLLAAFLAARQAARLPPLEILRKA
jgi:lipoprotein-releasing system permease protein